MDLSKLSDEQVKAGMMTLAAALFATFLWRPDATTRSRFPHGYEEYYNEMKKRGLTL